MSSSLLPMSELISGGGRELLSTSTLFFLEARLALVQAGTSSTASEEIVSQMGVSINTIENLNVAILTQGNELALHNYIAFKHSLLIRLGRCLNARTSGVLFVVGVGSYCAYRFCRRIFGSNFVWTLLEAAKCDLLLKADNRLFHTAAEGFYTVRLGEDDLQEIQKFIDNNAESVFEVELDDNSAIENSKNPSKNWTRNFRKIHRISLKNHEKGLAAVASLNSCVEDNDQVGLCVASVSSIPGRRFSRRPNLGVQHKGRIDELRSKTVGPARTTTPTLLFDDEDNQSICSFNSDLTSVSRQRVNRRRDKIRKITEKHPSYEAEDTWEESSHFSRARSASVASTSLRLLWQGEPEWEDEFQDSFEDDQSGISQLSAVINLEKMLKSYSEEDIFIPEKVPSTPDRRLNLAVKNEGSLSSRRGSLRFFHSEADEEFESRIRLKYGLEDDSYMYQSVPIERRDLEPSEVMSLCSSRGGSTYSMNLSQYSHNFMKNNNRNKPSKKNASHGLWELTSLPSRLSSEKFHQGVLLASTPQQLNSSINGATSGPLEQQSTDEDWLRNDDDDDGKNEEYFPTSSSFNAEKISSTKNYNETSRKNSNMMFDSAIAMSDSMSSGTMMDAPTEIDSRNPSNMKFKKLAATTRTGKSSGVASNASSSSDNNKCSVFTAGIFRRVWLNQISELSPQTISTKKSLKEPQTGVSTFVSFSKFQPERRFSRSSSITDDDKNLEWF